MAAILQLRVYGLRQTLQRNPFQRIFLVASDPLRAHRSYFWKIALAPASFKSLLMQPNLPIWLQRLSPETRRQLELAIATATEARLDVHAQQALNVVAVLASRVSFDLAVDRYIDVMGLTGDEAQIVQTRTLVLVSQTGVAEELARERRSPNRLNWRYATPLGAVRFVRRQLRRNAEEDLWMELSAARAEEALIRMHVKHALTVVGILEEHFPPTRAVALYLEQLAVPSSRSRSIYQRALARIAAAELPRLTARRDLPFSEIDRDSAPTAD